MDPIGRRFHPKHATDFQVSAPEWLKKHPGRHHPVE
jgi:hypothetical protein